LKVKIPPYPNYRITESLFEKVKSDTVKTTNSEPLSSKLIMISEFKTGEKRVIRASPIKHNNNLYVSAFTHPVHLLLSVAIEHFNL